MNMYGVCTATGEPSSGSETYDQTGMTVEGGLGEGERRGRKRTRSERAATQTYYLNENERQNSIPEDRDADDNVPMPSWQEYYASSTCSIHEPEDEPSAKKQLSEVYATTLYVKGECQNNTDVGPIGGIGIWLGDGVLDKNNISCRVPECGTASTSNRAELWAAIAALEYAYSRGLYDVVIRSDSQYLIRGMNVDLHGWNLAGKLVNGTLDNYDLWLDLEALASKVCVDWEHVNGDRGTGAALKLASDGIFSEDEWLLRNPDSAKWFEYRRILGQNNARLVTDLTVGKELLNHMTRGKVFTEEEVQNILCAGLGAVRNQQFVMLLGTRLPSGFSVFIMGLIITLQHDLADALHREIAGMARAELAKNSHFQSEEPPSTYVSRYEVDFEQLECLGRGGYGVVFQARNKLDDCNYAVKRIALNNSERSKQKVLREVKALARLDHDGIVRFYNAWVEDPPCGWQEERDRCTGLSPESSSCGSLRDELSDLSMGHSSQSSDATSSPMEKCLDPWSTDGDSRSIEGGGASPRLYLYIQMQLCRRDCLKDWLNTHTEHRDRVQLLDIFLQIVKAVDYVHSNGMMHRDLKPSNIFFARNGVLKIGDFGLVTAMEEQLEAEHQGGSQKKNRHTKEVGTKLYMSPELSAGRDYNCSVDVYAMGVIFFELFWPFGTEMERIKTLTGVRQLAFPQDFIIQLPAEHAFVKKLVAHSPTERPSTAKILKDPLLAGAWEMTQLAAKTHLLARTKSI